MMSYYLFAFSARDKNRTNKVVNYYQMLLKKSASYCPLEITRYNSSQPNVLVSEKRTITNTLPLQCGSYSYQLTIDKTIFNELTVNFTNYTERSPSEMQFRLSHYGLPEPEGVELPPSSFMDRYFWLLLGVGVFIVLAVTFRYLSRRRAATATT
jgi:hypothetical protein